MNNIFELLQKHITKHQHDFGDGESVLTLLYEAYSECSRLDDAQVKSDFEELYHLMKGRSLQEMDQIIYPVCKLCRDHERTGFVEGIKIGIRQYGRDVLPTEGSAHGRLHYRKVWLI